MTAPLDTLCAKLDAIRNELRALAREQRRAANKDVATECDEQADKLTELSDNIALFIAPHLKQPAQLHPMPGAL